MAERIAVLLAGVALTLAGHFGPADGGTLEFIGLAIIGIALFLIITE